MLYFEPKNSYIFRLLITLLSSYRRLYKNA